MHHKAVKGGDAVCSMSMVDIHVDVAKQLQVWLKRSLWITKSIIPSPFMDTLPLCLILIVLFFYELNMGKWCRITYLPINL